VAKALTRFLENSSSLVSERNLLQLFSRPENEAGKLPVTSAGIPQRGPVSWRLAALLALMVLPLLSACTGRDIGGVGTGWNPPVSEGEVVYVGTKEGQVKSYIDHGFEGVRPNWTFPTGDGSIDLEGVYSTPLIVGGLLYVAAQDGFLYALEPE
jgi:hypothetical protein